ncbi:threonine--tRNA ligase [Patescibacteria group bacterium]|nr:threonine--tRNA ligase [Patescibacteria group bacterium]
MEIPQKIAYNRSMVKKIRDQKTDKKSGLAKIRHSASHLLAEAVLNLYPKTKLGFGPATEDGFYYDFEFVKPITDTDLPRIEKEMQKLINQGLTFKKSNESVGDAIKWTKKNDQPYKEILIQDLKTEKKIKQVSFYTSGNFTDLCEGPHVKSSKEICAFKLLSLAGAYWRGDERNPQLTRIYGTAFATKAELDEYLLMLEEDKKRDHRKLGKELGIFTFDDDIGPGLPLWLPNGTVIIELLEQLAKKLEAEGGYKRVKTPSIAKESLYLKSGHLPYYEDAMFPKMELEGTRYYLKAMNCPHHHKIFDSEPRSYRDLPLRLAEFGTCYRYEKSGELFGLMRSRMLSMNDAHIYCTKEQFEVEFQAVNEMYLKYFKLLGIDKYVMRFSTHDPKKLGGKYVDEPKLWKVTEDMVRQALRKAKIPYVEVADEAAFYGPKIDVQVWSAIGREFSLATNQVDFSMPKRFNLAYVNAKGETETPICIHRSPLGTHERTIGFLLEHYAGIFPFWLAPVQIAILPITEKQHSYAKKILAELQNNGFRVSLDDRNESLGRKIRDAELQKVSYMLVIGEKEATAKTLSIRELVSNKQFSKSLPQAIKFFLDLPSPLR